MLSVQVEKIFTHAMGDFRIQVDFKTDPGEIVAIYGPSGCGKSSVMRMISGLLRPDRGLISFGDEVWFDGQKSICLKPQKRAVGLVFQDFALFPNMTVRENIFFGCRASEDPELCQDLIDVMGMRDFENQKADLLSGGQKQRVALARALANRPKCLMLDEPFSALDLRLRTKLQKEFLSLHKRYAPTTLIVSHEPIELCRLANRVVVMEQGQMAHQGFVQDVFQDDIQDLRLALDEYGS